MISKRWMLFVSLALPIGIIATIVCWSLLYPSAEGTTGRDSSARKTRQAAAQTSTRAARNSWKTLVHEGKSLEQWAKDLRSEDPDLRRQAAEALIEAGEPAYPALAQALTFSRDESWEKAVAAVAAVGGDAVPALLSLIRGEKGVDLRHNAGPSALMQMGPAALPALREALRDKEEAIRLAAVTGLRFLGTMGAVDETTAKDLVFILHTDPSEDVRAAAADTLGFFRPMSPAVLDGLVKSLEIDSERVRLHAAHALASARVWLQSSMETPPPETEAGLDVLIAGLDSDDEEIRFLAYSGLSLLGPAAEPAIPALIRALDRPNVDYDIGMALESIGQAAVPALREATRSGKPQVRINAAKILANLGYAGQAEADDLLRGLKDPDPSVRQDTIYAIQTTAPDDPRIVPALIEMLDNEERWVRDRAAYALSRYGPAAKPAIPHLLEMIRQGEVHGPVHALGEMGPAAEGAIPTLKEALAENPLSGAERALARIGRPALPALRSLLDHSEPRVQSMAANGLGYLGSDAAPAVPDLIALLGSDDEEVCLSAARALGGIGPAAGQDVPSLTKILEEDDRSARHWAAVALGRIGKAARPALPALVAAAERKPGDASLEVVEALLQLDAGEQAVPALIAMAREAKYFRIEAMVWMAKLGADAAPAADMLRAIMNDPQETESIRLSAAYDLAHAAPEDQSATALLGESLGSGDEWMRVASAAALAEVRQRLPEAEASLRPLLDRPEREVTVAAAEVLLAVAPGDAEATQALSRALGSNTRQVQLAAAQAQARAGTATGKTLEVLVRGIDDRMIPMKGPLVESIGYMGQQAKSAAPTIEPFRYDMDHEKRRAAELALAKLRGELPRIYQRPGSTETLFSRIVKRVRPGAPISRWHG